MCSREPLPNAWVDPWSCTLVDKTLDVFLGPQMCSNFWGNLVFDQVDLGVITICVDL